MHRAMRRCPFVRCSRAAYVARRHAVLQGSVAGWCCRAVLQGSVAGRLVLRGLQLAPGQQEREGALGEALLEPPHVPGQRLAARGADLRLS